MTLEERIELHEQWLLSMESNHSQFAADLAALGREAQETREQISQITGILAQVVQNQAVLSANLAALTETVNQYIRFRSDGKPEN